MKKFIELLKKNFKRRLQIKTGWGKNEVMAEFERAITESLLEIVDKEDK